MKFSKYPMTKIALIAIFGVGCLAWAGSFKVFPVQAQDGEQPLLIARDSKDRPSKIQPVADNFQRASSSATISPTPKETPTSTPVVTESPVSTPTPSSTLSPEPKSNGALASIVDFFKKGPGSNPPAADASSRTDRGLNFFGSDPKSSYDYSPEPASEKEVWYGLVIALVCVGVSTFMYGRSKKI